MGDRNIYVVVHVVRNFVSNLVGYLSSGSSIYRSVVCRHSVSEYRFSLLKFDVGGNVVLGWLSDFLSVDSSSRNSVVHGSVNLTGLNRKSYNFFRVSYSRRISELKSGFFGVVNRLNEILSVNNISWYLNFSNSVVSFVGGRLNLWFEGSSNFRRVYQLYVLSVISNGRLNVSIVLGDWSSYLHVSRFSSVSSSYRSGNSVSSFDSSRKSVKSSLSIFSKIENSVLVIYNLSNRSGESFGEDFRFSSYSSYLYFRLSSYVLGDNSWLKFDFFGLTLLSFLS